MKGKNPIVEEVMNQYLTIQKMTEIFVKNPNAAMRGLLISGDAGFGKTHFTKLGLQGVEDIDNVDYVKGSSITAPMMYIKLWQSRKPGQILVLDDVDIVHKPTAERSAILDLFKGATEPTTGFRTLEWARASPNQMMRDLRCPTKFDFEGSVIWITNETIESLSNKAKSHWNAISSRFRQIPVWLTDQEKVLYTLHLIEEVNILGSDCQAKEGGYSEEIIDKTAEYIRNNWKYMNDVSPRISISIADTIDNFPEDWQIYCEHQFLNN
jgi:hypothetical protein